MIHTGLESQMARELRSLRDRFQRAVIESGTDEEFARLSTPEADRLIAYHEQVGGPSAVPKDWTPKK